MVLFYYFWLIWVITITVIFGDESFEPNFQLICTQSSANLKIITEKPFDGIVYSVGYRQTCTVMGNGTLETNFIIPFHENNDDKCGVKYNKEDGLFWVQISVHNSVISDIPNRLFNVSCDINTSLIYQPKFDYFLNLHSLPQIDNKQSDGNSYTLNAFMAYFEDINKYRNRVKITNCFIESGDGNAVEIIDSEGCSTNPKFITNVFYKDVSAYFNLSSVNPYLKVLNIKCKFSVCSENELCRKSCDEDRWYNSIFEGTKKWFNFDESLNYSSTNLSMIDDEMIFDRSTIVHSYFHLHANAIPSKTNIFIENCKLINFYLFAFEHCGTAETIFWLYFIAFFGCFISFSIIFWNIFQCYRKIKATRKDSSDSDSEDSVWLYENFKTSKTQGVPVKVINMSEIYDKPYVKIVNFVPKVPDPCENIPCIEQNPCYVCQKSLQDTYV